MRELAKLVDVLLVVGARNSSNSRRLAEIGTELGIPSYLIEDAKALNPEWISGKTSIGITAGASAPDKLVTELIESLRQYADIEVSTLPGVDENVRFRLPPELTDRAKVA